VLDSLDNFVAIEVERGAGRVVKQSGDGHLVVFDQPATAVDTALRILEGASTFEVELRAGIHTGEVELRHDGDVAGITVHIAQRVAAIARPRELLVSRTVADLLAGSGTVFQDRGQHTFKGIAQRWRVFVAHHP
jgi:class 3 adenylate cyclase